MNLVEWKGTAVGSFRGEKDRPPFPGSDPERRAFFARPVVLAAALGLLLIPLFAHGCHGDDVDHEPSFAPPVAQPERLPGS